METDQKANLELMCDNCGANDAYEVDPRKKLSDLECEACFTQGGLVLDDFPIHRSRSRLFQGIHDGKRFEFDPVGMRKRIMDNFTLLTFDDVVYKYNKVTCTYDSAEAWLRKIISDGLRDNDRSKYAEEVISQIKANTNLKSYPSPDPMHLPFANGVYEIDTGLFRDYRASDFFFNHFQARYDPTLQCPDVDSFFDTVVDHEVEAKNLMEWASLCLVRKVVTAKMLLLVGYGRNGKSLYADLLRTLLGEGLHTSISLHDLKEFGLEPLYHYRPYLNTSGELSSKKELEQDVLKKLISGEAITLNRKNKQFVTMKPTTKFLSLTNEIPENMRDLSDGWCRRILPVYFEKQFKEDEDYRERVTSIDQVSAWASCVLVPNLKQILANKGIIDAPAEDAVRSFFAENMNSITAFCESHLVYTGSSEDLVMLEEVQESYDAFCIREKIKRSSNISLGKGIKRFFRIKQKVRWNEASPVEAYTMRDPSGQDRFVECYKGIRLLKDG